MAAAAGWRRAAAAARPTFLWAAQALPTLVQASSMAEPQLMGLGSRGLASVPWHIPQLPLQERRRHQQALAQAACLPPLMQRLHTKPADSFGSSDSGAGSKTASPEHHKQRHAAAAGAAAAFQSVGWSRQEVLNLPNALSLGRLLSGPLIASWILDAQWSLALPALALSGATDWADGWAARRFNQRSVIGSYLDPLADKVLICSVVGALGWSGAMPPSVVAIIVGRDVVLVGGAFAARAKSLGWRWPGLGEFFRVGPPPTAAGGVMAGGARSSGAGGEGSQASDGSTAAPAPLVQPLYISKVNTVFQLGLVGACILDSWLGWPGDAAITAGSAATAATTVASCWAYLQAYRAGRVLSPSAPRQDGPSE